MCPHVFPPKTHWGTGADLKGMRSTDLWKREGTQVEEKLSSWWPDRISIGSPQAEKQVYVALEARIGRLFLGKKHDTFMEFHTARAIYDRFEIELKEVREGKPPPNLIADKVHVAEDATSDPCCSASSVRFDAQGKAVDEGILLQEAGLLPGTYLMSKLPKPTDEGTLLLYHCLLVELIPPPLAGALEVSKALRGQCRRP